MPERQDKLREKFASKKYRSSYVAAHVYMRIALQVTALREQRGWTQAELAKRMGSWQSVVSRIEDGDQHALTVNTLIKLARAFDIPLIVEMPSWEEWFAKMRDISPEALQRFGWNDVRNSLSQPCPTDETTAAAPTLGQGEGR